VGTRLIAALSMAALLCCCSSYPTPPPATPVQAASPEMRLLRVHVYQGARPPETPEDERDYKTTPGYTHGLRRSFLGALQQAGYTVVLERTAPRDLVAVIHAEWLYDHPGVASLTLRRGDEVVDQLSVVVGLLGTPPHTVHLEQQAAVDLVDALTSSPRVQAFVRAHPRGESEVAGPGEGGPGALP
jgi:hypothetical protein